MTQNEIQAFWDAHPCGEDFVEQLTEDYEAFFDAYDRFRYSLEGHIPGILDDFDFEGKEVLEIGLGQGADSEQLVRRGASWCGIDITRQSVARVRARFHLRGLPCRGIVQGSAVSLPFPDQSFDVVFSHGVLHHIPEIDQAQREIARVLRPSGTLLMMVYAKGSLNYLASIWAIRRAALALLHLYPGELRGKAGEHLRNARKMGLVEYLKMSNFIHRNTDGPHNPYSRVYTLNQVKTVFNQFQVTAFKKHFRHAPPLPVSWVPFEKLWGWHLWIRASKSDG